MELDTVVTFTLTPTASGTRLSLVQVRLQTGPEAEFWWRALRLEDDGREARRPAREDPMNWNTWIRQIHRWLSNAFTLTVIANFVVMTQGPPPAWVTYSPLLPLGLLLFTGLYLFALPYATRWRSARRANS